MHVIRPATLNDSALKWAVARAFATAAMKGVGAQTVSAHLSKHESIVYKMANPNDHTAFISVHDIPLLAEIMDVTPILDALCELAGGKFVRGDAANMASPESIRSAALRVAVEAGEVAAAVRDGLADDILTPDEARRIHDESAGLIGSVHALGANVRGPSVNLSPGNRK